MTERTTAASDDDEGRARRERERAVLVSKLDKDPDPVSWARLVELLTVDGHDVEAARVCDEGILLYPACAELHVMAGELAARAGQPQRAREQFEEAVQVDRFSCRALMGLARACMELGARAEAAALARRMLAFLPAEPEATELLRRAQASGGDEPGAR